MYKSMGERLSYCRNLLGISRRELVEAIGGISLPTLSRWELNYVEITRVKLDYLIKFFKKNGIDVSPEWILYEGGQPPINNNLQNFDKLNFDELSYLTLSNLKNNIENFEIYQVNSNFFEPLICNGDYIGGVTYDNLEILTNKLCYIIGDMVLYIGIFNYEHMSITNMFKQTIKINAVMKIGAVTWIAKRG